MFNPWLGMGLVLAILAGLIGGLRWYQQVFSPHPELVRKILHMGMGLVTLSFPWVFNEAWPVLVLAGTSIAGLLSLRVLKILQAGVGNVVAGVGRSSLGEIYFPIAVAILFVFYQRRLGELDPGRRLCLYCIPILLLTLADAAAALIGVAYGQTRFATADGHKSAEGSIACFMCAFFCVHVPLLLDTETDKVEVLLIAILLAWLVTMFEAIAWSGLDNLVLPLVSYLLLKIYLDKSAAELGARFALTALLMGLLLIYGRRTTLVGSAFLGALLAGYIACALGGWHWLLAPLILFLSYTWLSPRNEINSRRVHNIHAVVAVTSAGFVWLFLSQIMNRPDFLFPYTLSFAANLAIIGVARLRLDYPQLATPTLLGICIFKGWAFMFAPYLLAEGVSGTTLTQAAVALPAVALAAIGFFFTQPHIEDCPTDTPRWFRQAANAALGSLAGFVPLFLM